MKKLLFITLFVFLTGGISVVHAQTPTWMQSGQDYVSNPCAGNANKNAFQTSGNITYTPLEPFTDCDAGAGGYASFPYYLSTIFKILISFGTLSAVVMLVWGGITYIVSDAVDMKGNAKKRIQAALLGLALLAGSYLILNTINPDLLKFNLNFSSLSTGARQDTTTTGTSVGDTTTLGRKTATATEWSSVKKTLGLDFVTEDQGGKEVFLFDPKSKDEKTDSGIKEYEKFCEESGIKNTLTPGGWFQVKAIEATEFGAPGKTALVCVPK